MSTGRVPGDIEPTAAGRDQPARFDVFLSYDARDVDLVERVATRLKRAGLEPWLDRWRLTPGVSWQRELADGLRASGACAVFIGRQALGSWETEEFAVALDRAAKDPGYRVVPVLLPNLPDPFDPTTLPPFLATRTWVDLRSGVEHPRALQSLVNAIKGVPVGSDVPIEPRDDVSPYRGLRAFEEEDADFFFGRDADVQRLLEKLKGRRFLAIVGASGSGKSSLVRAGLLPALRHGALPESDSWKVCVLTPGARPLDELAALVVALSPHHPSMQATVDGMADDARSLHLAVAAALPPGARVLWLVDQLEEVFTLAPADQRVPFLANLLYASSIQGGRNVVVVVVRADFFSQSVHAELSQQIAANPFLVAPMSRNQLRLAIEEPARRVGVELEEGLAATILDDVERQPGALPLLEHALLELWERRRGGMLTLEGYRESGGVAGALAQRADQIYTEFAVHEREIERRLLLRLTQPGEWMEDTRRRATMGELLVGSGNQKAVEQVVATLVAARLLTTSGDAAERYVEVSHEALIRGWPRLRRWVDEDRESLRVHRRLTDAANEWQRLGRDDALLYRGARLAETLEWSGRDALSVNELERAFLEASVRLRRRGRLARAGALTAILVVVLGLAVLAKPRIETYLLRVEALDRSPMARLPGTQVWLGGSGDRPRELVLVAAFSIDLHEVTNSQYRRCVDAEECSQPDQPSNEVSYREANEDLPVVYLTARQAAAFCRWLGRRLPSEAEWERAARGAPGRLWPWGSQPPTPGHANLHFKQFPPRGLVPVNDTRFARDATPEGIVHLVGNAREWTATPADCSPSQYRCSRRWDATGPVNALVIRGNGWEDPWHPITGSDALRSDPAEPDADTGFRCASSDE
jgi:Sulfatase-modifying factor enzyme 1/TIR domain